MAADARVNTPLFIVCKRKGCGKLRQVRRPWQQRRGGYCSRRCASLVNQNIRRGIAKGVAGSLRARKRRVLARLSGLTKVECFQLGYKRGLYSKLGQIRRRFDLVRKGSAA